MSGYRAIRSKRNVSRSVIWPSATCRACFSKTNTTSSPANPKRPGVLSLAAESGSGFVAFSPLAQGLLTGRYLNGIPQDSRMAEGRSLRSDVLTDAMLTRIRELNDLARRRGQTLAEMALAWLLSDRRVTSVIIGASSTAQIGGQPAGVGKRRILRRGAG